MILFKFFELLFSFQNRIYYFHWLSSRKGKGKSSLLSVAKALNIVAKSAAHFVGCLTTFKQ